jgi:methylenetetrahydrofolate reductase (NADPH)
MRNVKSSGDVVKATLRSARYEVLPTAKIEAAVIDSVPRDVTLTVTASPAKGIGATLDLTERLIGHG